MSFSFKKSFLDDMEKGIKKKLEEVKKDLAKNPGMFGGGVQVEGSPVEAKAIPIPRAQSSYRQQGSNAASQLSGGYGSSLRSRFESLTAPPSMSGAFGDLTQSSSLRQSGGTTAEELTMAERASNKLMADAAKKKQAAVNRSIAKKRVRASIRR